MPLVDGKYIGFCAEHTLPFKRGDKVRIAKGQKIRTTHPKRREIVAKKDYVIEVFDVSPGMTRDATFGSPINQNPTVIWVGAGGYWHEIDINEAVKV